jgi:hypothetical protein
MEIAASSAQPPACRQARIEELIRAAISMAYVSWHTGSSKNR